MQPPWGAASRGLILDVSGTISGRTGSAAALRGVETYRIAAWEPLASSEAAKRRKLV